MRGAQKMSAVHVARVAQTKVHSKMIEAGVILWEKQVIPAMKSAEGFRHVYVLGDDATHTIMTISLWDSEAAAEAWDNSETQKTLRGHLTEFVTSMPMPETFLVKLEA
jgi:heme-degrading monooxygenase HmoA